MKTSSEDFDLVVIGGGATQGVHLATCSALLAARSINSCLAGTVDEGRAFDEYEVRYRREYGLSYDYLTSLYDMNRDREFFLWEARNPLNTEERATKRSLGCCPASLPSALQSRGNISSTRARALAPALEQIMNPKASDPAVDMSGKCAAQVTSLLPELHKEAQGLQMLATVGGDRPAEKPFRPVPWLPLRTACSGRRIRRDRARGIVLMGRSGKASRERI